jgi:hypothetical protein
MTRLGSSSTPLYRTDNGLTTSQKNKSGEDVTHPNTRDSLDRDQEDDSEDNANNDGMNTERTHSPQAETISLDVGRLWTTSQEHASRKSTPNCKAHLADQSDILKLRSAQTKGNSECDTDTNSSESELPAAIGEKTDRIGGIGVLEELRDTISDLRLHTCPLPTVAQESDLVMPKHLQSLPSFAHKLWL